MWPTTPPDHLLNFVLGGAAVLTILGVTVGGWFGLRYGRRASVSLTATVDEREGGCLVVIRPSIKAVGILRVKFKKGAAGSQVDIVELKRPATGQIQMAMIPGARGVFGDSFLEGGEDLLTTVIVPVRSPSDDVVGWAVELRVHAPNRFLRFGWLGHLLRARPSQWLLGTRLGRFFRWVARVLTWRRLRLRLRNIVFAGGWTWIVNHFFPTRPKPNFPDMCL